MSATISQLGVARTRGRVDRQGKRVAGPRLIVPAFPNARLRALRASPVFATSCCWKGFIRPANSIKEFLFPKHEELYGYRITGKGIELNGVEPLQADQMLIAARPCDAALCPSGPCVQLGLSGRVLQHAAAQLTTVVTLACTEHDDPVSALLSASGPQAERGSDVHAARPR